MNRVVLFIVVSFIFIGLAGYSFGYQQGKSDTYEVIKNEKPLSKVLYKQEETK